MNENTQHTFIAVLVESIVVNTVLNFSLYSYDRAESAYVLYQPYQTGFSKKQRQALLEKGVTTLFIISNEHEAYQQYIEEHLHQIIESAELRAEERASIIYQSARHLMQGLMDGLITSDLIDRVRRFVKNTVQYILVERNHFFNIINFAPHDYYTYTHSINVCVYSLSLGRRLGMVSPYKMANLGTGALLHDVGKKTIAPEVLLKKGKLNDEEWEIIKQHPSRGVELLNQHQVLHTDILNIVRHHHEKLDGSGYPDKLTGRSIPLFAKIVCIADIFDALNTNRPYKEAADTFHSLEVMNQQFQGKIDQELFHEFVLLFKK